MIPTERRRLSEYGRPSQMSETDLVAAYTTPNLVARPCACAGVVVADQRDPTEGVRLHQSGPKHVAWRDRLGL